MEDFVVKEGVDTQLPMCAYKCNGYRFKGWNTESNGKGKTYQDGDMVNLKEDLKLYAQWEEIKVKKDDGPKKDEIDNEKEVKPIIG